MQSSLVGRHDASLGGYCPPEKPAHGLASQFLPDRAPS